MVTRILRLGRSYIRWPHIFTPERFNTAFSHIHCSIAIAYGTSGHNTELETVIIGRMLGTLSWGNTVVIHTRHWSLLRLFHELQKLQWQIQYSSVLDWWRQCQRVAKSIERTINCFQYLIIWERFKDGFDYFSRRCSFCVSILNQCNYNISTLS
jgi:hypothetical protein